MRIFPLPRFSFAPLLRWCATPAFDESEPVEPIRVRGREKLRLLQRLDRTGSWSSLEEKRHCRRCGAIFNGRQIDIVGGTRALGPLRLLCPSDDCAATPNEWVRLEQDGRARPVVAAHPAVAMAPVFSEYGNILAFRRDRRRGRKKRRVSAEPSREAEVVNKIVRMLHPLRVRTEKPT